MIRTIGLISAGMAAIVSLIAAIAVWTSQASSPGSNVWPLPALVLINWAVLGLAPFFAVYGALLRARDSLLAVPWIAVGGLIPLIFLGALSIGLLVAASALLVLIPAVLFAIWRRQTFTHIAGLVLAGAVANLALLFLFIALGSGAA